MSVIEGFLIFIAILLLYTFIVFILHRKKIFEKYNISFFGPALMWRTIKGRALLQKIGKWKRFWKISMNIGIIVCFITMIFMVSLLIINSWVILELTPEQREEIILGPETALPIPGLNPILPIEYVGYIIIAFIVAIIAHEFSHGILTYASNLKVKSLGILYLIIPIGAFVEPDEEQLKKTKASNRMRIFAAGPTMNYVVVLVTILLLSMVFMSSVQLAAEGMNVFYVGENTPAEEIGLNPGMIIVSLNNSNVTDFSDFYTIMQNTSAGQELPITYMESNKKYNTTVILADKSEFTQNESDQGQGYLGVGSSPISPNGFLSLLKNPFLDFPMGFLTFFYIPVLGYFQGYNPLVDPYVNAFIITGPLSIIPTNIFWIIVNALYWIFWLNFAVAIFNVLPIGPLDGGLLFKDGINVMIKRIKKNITKEKSEALVGRITLTISLVLLFLILFPWIMKFLTPLF